MVCPMKRFLIPLLLGLALASCSSDPVARPFVAQPIAKKKPEPAPVKPKDAPRKVFAGKVTFQGVPQKLRSQIKIIPENGSALTIPENQVYDQVDGFWYQGVGGQWFKIPDHSEAWVGEAPGEYEGTADRDDLKIYYRGSTFGGLVGTLRGGVKGPAWVPDSGDTKSPVPSPF